MFFARYRASQTKRGYLFFFLATFFDDFFAFAFFLAAIMLTSFVRKIFFGNILYKVQIYFQIFLRANALQHAHAGSIHIFGRVNKSYQQKISV